MLNLILGRIAFRRPARTKKQLAVIEHYWWKFFCKNVILFCLWILCQKCRFYFTSGSWKLFPIFQVKHVKSQIFFTQKIIFGNFEKAEGGRNFPKAVCSIRIDTGLGVKLSYMLIPFCHWLASIILCVCTALHIA